MTNWVPSRVETEYLELRFGDNLPFYFGDKVHGDKSWKAAPVWKKKSSGSSGSFEWELRGVNLYHLTPCHIKIEGVILPAFTREPYDYDESDPDVTDRDKWEWELIGGLLNQNDKLDTIEELCFSGINSPGWIHIGFLSYNQEEVAQSVKLCIAFWSCSGGCSDCQKTKSASASVPSIYSPLITGLEDSCLSSNLSDFTLEVNGEEIPAHKIMLFRVPYFKALFESDMTEARSNRLQVKDYDTVHVKAVLTFIYCAKLPEDLDDNCAAYMLIADHYGMDELKNACSEVLLKNLRRANVVDTLMVADRHCCAELKQECLRLLHDWRDSMSHQQFEPLKAVPELMFECLTRRHEN